MVGVVCFFVCWSELFINIKHEKCFAFWCYSSKIYLNLHKINCLSLILIHISPHFEHTLTHICFYFNYWFVCLIGLLPPSNNLLKRFKFAIRWIPHLNLICSVMHILFICFHFIVFHVKIWKKNIFFSISFSLLLERSSVLSEMYFEIYLWYLGRFESVIFFWVNNLWLQYWNNRYNRRIDFNFGIPKGGLILMKFWRFFKKCFRLTNFWKLTI